MALLSTVPVDGSPAAVDGLVTALRHALAGGPAVLPVGPGESGVAGDPGEGAAVVIATSGSTGAAKHVVLSAGALQASAQATAERLGGPARWLLALPAHHVAGVQVVVRSLLAGTPPVVQDLRAGFRPEAFAAATRELGPDRRCTSLVPTQLGRILDSGGAALDALRGYSAVLVGGAALAPQLHERALAAGIAVVTTYGMSETAGGCVYDGVPLGGVRVELEEGGRIRLGGPTLADGYLGDSGLTAAAFADGWFRTGDLGRWRAGRLEVLGRADDMIVTGGEKVAPAAVETVLTAQDGVTAACVVGVPDPEWGQVVAAAVVVDGSLDGALAERLRAAVRAALGRTAVPRVLRAVPRIPLRGIGKPDRMATARLITADAGPAPIDTASHPRNG
ncbi:O-succinylbenzoic acid--CoA ligase [Pseudonocardia hierapolitana]|uniref:O-succinylbenzoic acid--CoA ligase n=1 Tax=Pseudonocardia hierapolitana TaxID=1128676 RepID=A0A561STG6_9PSEU|nr:O-succinylbenzoic acid--CoA ligase [Pseudonocardia hierapolitana]